MGSIFTALPSVKVHVAQAEEADHSDLVGRLVAYPATAERYQARGCSLGSTEPGEPDPEEQADAFHYEHPDYTDAEQLQPTSGRKKWALRHNKAIKKKLKADKTGYIGS